jgi:flagellar biosynthesis GTPase FlhF
MTETINNDDEHLTKKLNERKRKAEQELKDVEHEREQLKRKKMDQRQLEMENEIKPIQDEITGREKELEQLSVRSDTLRMRNIKSNYRIFAIKEKYNEKVTDRYEGKTEPGKPEDKRKCAKCFSLTFHFNKHNDINYSTYDREYSCWLCDANTMEKRIETLEEEQNEKNEE